MHNLNSTGGSLGPHLVKDLELVPLFLGAVPSNWGDVEHSLPELDEGASEWQ